MKKLLSLTLAIIMVCLAVASLTSCGKDPTPIPEGYVKYDNGDIYFGYPENWKKTDGSIVTLSASATGGNNITIVEQEKTNEFKDYDLAFFNENMKPAYELMGMTISNAAVELTENENGIEILKISYTAKFSGVPMKQTQFIANGSNNTYIITVTEVTDDATLVANVFETFNLSK